MSWRSQNPRLAQLEAEAIHIMREGVAEFRNRVMLYSVGKDSSAMLRIAQKAFAPAKPPFPLLHIDTTWRFREMIAFRDDTAKRLETLQHSHQVRRIDACVSVIQIGTELDVWQNIKIESIPVVSLYFAKDRPIVERDGALIMVDDHRLPLRPSEAPKMICVRFRTLGCYPLTGAFRSQATPLDCIIAEMRQSRTSERQSPCH